MTSLHHISLSRRRNNGVFVAITLQPIASKTTHKKNTTHPFIWLYTHRRQIVESSVNKHESRPHRPKWYSQMLVRRRITYRTRWAANQNIQNERARDDCLGQRHTSGSNSDDKQKEKKIWLQKKSILRSVLLNSIIKLKENRCEKPRRWCCCSCVVDGIPRNKLRTVVLTTHTAQEQNIRQPERLKKWNDFAIYFCSFLQASFLGKCWCARGFGIGIRVHCALDSCGKNMIPEQCFGKRKNISLYGMCWLVSFSHQTLYFICHTETPLTGRAQATIDNIPIWSVILIHILVIANICQKGFSFPSNRQYEYTQHTIWHTFIYTHILGTPKTERQVERLQLRLSFVLYMV